MTIKPERKPGYQSSNTSKGFILAGAHIPLLDMKLHGMVPLTLAIAPEADAVMLLPFDHVTIHKPSLAVPPKKSEVNDEGQNSRSGSSGRKRS